MPEELSRSVGVVQPHPNAAGSDARTSSKAERLGRSKARRDESLTDEQHPKLLGEHDWQQLSVDERKDYIEQVKDEYFSILDDYAKHANLAVLKYNKMSLSNEGWRKRMIIATGILALINTVAAFELVSDHQIVTYGNSERAVTLSAVLSAIAAIWALGLTIFQNLENFFNAGEKAAGFRESREVLVTIYRRYLQRWTEYVEGSGVWTARACVNAGFVYRELVEADREVRSKIKNLTEPQERPPEGVQSASGQG